MKKTLFFIISLFFIFSLTGCYSHYEDVKLLDVRFYDTQGNEIAGEYKNYFRENFDDEEESASNGYTLLNSAAPIVNFYCAYVEEGTTIKVVMEFKVNKGKLTSLTLKRQNDASNKVTEMDSIVEDKNSTFVTYTVENVSSSNNLFRIYTWSNGESQEYFSEKGGNTYIRGFYLKIKTETVV